MSLAILLLTLQIITALHLKNKCQCCQTPPFSCPVCMWESLYKNYFLFPRRGRGKKHFSSLFWKTKARRWLHTRISCSWGSLKASVQTAEGCSQFLTSTFAKAIHNLSHGDLPCELSARETVPEVIKKELDVSFYYITLTQSVKHRTYKIPSHLLLFAEHHPVFAVAWIVLVRGC